MPGTLRIVLAAACIGAVAACDGTTSPRPGPPAALAFMTEPTSVASTQSLGSVTVALNDAEGRLSTNATGDVTIALENGGDSAHLSGQMTVTAIAGIATFTDLHVDKAGSAYRLLATAASIASAHSAAFQISVGPAAALVISAAPATVEAGHTMPPVEVDVVDAGGNPVQTASMPISIALANTDAATLSGTTMHNAIAGHATFDDLSMIRVFGHQLIVTSFALVPDTVVVTITPGPAALLMFAYQPSSGTAGVTLPGELLVMITDQYGNPGYPYRNWGGVPVSIALENNPTGAALGGTTTVATFRGGSAFSISVDKPGTGYTLKATAPNLPSATSAPFNIAP